MKPNLSQDDIITISFCLGYTMGKVPVKSEKIIEVMKKITEPLIKKTKKEVKKALK
ncbi:hypothetical protein LCGC14_1871990 [marine sediment metagenome]|uniref:Uncharacterized protein n=1 Tax=marine sediment metagenome TaxID=412755 RepID=A0A0F9J3H1_9ZZZZ